MDQYIPLIKYQLFNWVPPNNQDSVSMQQDIHVPDVLGGSGTNQYINFVWVIYIFFVLSYIKYGTTAPKLYTLF